MWRRDVIVAMLKGLNVWLQVFYRHRPVKLAIVIEVAVLGILLHAVSRKGLHKTLAVERSQCIICKAERYRRITYGV